MYNANARSHIVDFSDGHLFTLGAQPIHIPTQKQSLSDLDGDVGVFAELDAAAERGAELLAKRRFIAFQLRLEGVAAVEAVGYVEVGCRGLAKETCAGFWGRAKIEE